MLKIQYEVLLYFELMSLTLFPVHPFVCNKSRGCIILTIFEDLRTNLSRTTSSSNLHAVAANYFLCHYRQTREPVSLTSLHGFLCEGHGDQREIALEIDSRGGDEEWQINVNSGVRGMRTYSSEYLFYGPAYN